MFKANASSVGFDVNDRQSGPRMHLAKFPVWSRDSQGGAPWQQRRKYIRAPPNKVPNAALRGETRVREDAGGTSVTGRSARSCSRLVISVRSVPTTDLVNGNGGFPRRCSGANHTTMGCREGEGKVGMKRGLMEASPDKSRFNCLPLISLSAGLNA